VTDLLYLGGLLLLTVAAFLVAVPLGIAAAGCALLFIGWASTPDKE
jgi:hypothetical protein